MKTNLCHVLGIEHPIIAAPMGPDLTGPELVAAVSNAGGLGILQAQFCSPLVFRQEIRRVRALTARPFGVNLLLHFPSRIKSPSAWKSGCPSSPCSGVIRRRTWGVPTRRA